MALYSDVLKKFQTDTVEILSQYFSCWISYPTGS